MATDPLPLWFSVVRWTLPVLLMSAGLGTAEWHGALDGDDNAAGTAGAPVRSPAAAEARARPGDAIVVHGGLWRERFAPTKGPSTLCGEIQADQA